MNLAHLSPEVETLFESLDDAGAAHRLHAVPHLPRPPPPPGLARRAAAARGRRDPAQVPPPHLGPDRALLRRPLREPRGALQIDLDPRQPRRLLGLLRRRAGRARTSTTSSSSRCPTTTTTPTATGPRRASSRSPRPTTASRQFVEAAGGLDEFLADHALILLADHAQTDGPPRPAAGRAAGRASGRCCSPPRTGPSRRSSRSARPAAPPTSTCSPARASGPSPTRCGERWPRSRASTSSAGWRAPTGAAAREEPGLPAAGGEWAVVERGERSCASGPAARSPTCAAGAGRSRGTSAALAATVEDGRLRSDEYPDPLARVWSALTAPTPATSSSRWRPASRRSTGAASATPAAAATARCTPATRSARCSSSAAGPESAGRARAVDAARRRAGGLRALRAASDAASGAARLLLLRSSLLAAAPRPPAAAGARRSARAEATRSPTATRRSSKERREHGQLSRCATMEDGNWEVAYFADGERGGAGRSSTRQTGEVRESWTGYQVAWKMARGYSGAFGHKLNAPYVFLPLCAIFLLGLVDWRRLWRVANLDLLVLLGFGVSHYFFNRAEIGVSVPLVYPVLALPARPLPVDRVPRARGGAAAGLAGGLAAGRRALPDGLPGRPQRRRLGRDRRRLRRRGRRRPDRPRGTDLRQLPRRRLPGRHLRPGQLPRLRSLRADLALVGQLGRPARRPRRRGRLRPRHLRLPDPARPAASGPGPRAAPRRDPRLRLGRLPLHRLRPRVELQRHPRRRCSSSRPSSLSPDPSPAAPLLAARDPGQVRAAPPRPDAA